MIRLYNTLTGEKENFRTIKKGEARMYSCGPTVYWFATIGNHRTYIFSDILKRVLKFNGLKVKHVINVTDVGHLESDADEGEDKIEKAAEKEGKTAKEIADYYLKVFKEDFNKLNILMPDLWPKATKHINEQIDLLKKLEKKGFTYETSDGIYFDTSKMKTYGQLAGFGRSKKKAGARVRIGDKLNVTDFALWKFSGEKERLQEWNSPWGTGFPGWHLECSAMSMKYLGNHFDLHTGGYDLSQVHHNNEIAQSESITGKKFVNYWLHGAFLIHRGKKVSKSTGGLYTVSELEEYGYNPMDLRYLCLLTHYRKPLNFTLMNLDSAKAAYERVKRKITELRKESRKGVDRTRFYEKKFLEAVNDDLNVPLGIQILWEALDDFDFEPKKKLELLIRFDEVLGLGIGKMKRENIFVPSDVKKLIEMRELLRAKKKWVEADIIRERIREKGYNIEDLSKGVKVSRYN